MVHKFVNFLFYILNFAEKSAVMEKEIIDEVNTGVVLADCVFQRWFMREFM